MPCPSSPAAVSTVTPVANWAMTSRSAVAGDSGSCRWPGADLAGVSLVDPLILIT
jgi:hypothetical protein